MARKYVNFRVGGSPYKETDAYTVWTNDLLGKVIASKTIIQPGGSKNDKDIIEKAKRSKVNMVLTKIRHFNH